MVSSSGVPKGGFKAITKKPMFLVGGVVVVGAVYLFQKRQKAATANVVPTTTTDLTGQIDPSTGLPFSQEGGFAGAFGSPYGGTSGFGTTGFGSNFPGSFFSGPQNPIVNAPTTNGLWAQEVEATLTQFGYDPATVAAALGAYLLGNALTSAQLGIVQAAIGMQGPPPVAVPAPHMAPPVSTIPSPAAVANGWYQLLPWGTHLQVTGSPQKRYTVTAHTLQLMTPKPKFIQIFQNSPVMRLPAGGNI